MRNTFLLLVLLTFAGPTTAGNWGQFLGPNRNGVITGDGHIPERPHLKLMWQRDLGAGYSGILVDDGKLFTMHAQGDRDVLACVRADNGETLWQYDIAPFFPKEGSAPGGPLSTPALDHQRVYGLGPRGDFFALEKETGKLVWQVHLQQDLGGVPPGVGFTTSPLVIGNRVILQVGNVDGKSMCAFDGETGALAWCTGLGEVGLQSPSLVQLSGRTYLMALHGNGISALDPETGQALWQHEGKFGIQLTPGGEHGFLLDDSGYTHYRLSQVDGTFQLIEQWKTTYLQEGGADFDFPVVHADLAMGFKGKIITCLNLKTGQRLWQTRMPAHGVTILVDGFLVTWCNGEIRLAQASGEAYQEAAMLKVFDAKERDNFTFPSYADGFFYLRDTERIAAVGVGK